MPTIAAGTGSIARPQPRIFSASWGTDNAVGCPSRTQGLDNIPVTFNWFIRQSSIQTTDFRVVRSDGSFATPTCALQFPPDESDERQTVNLIGDFGESVSGKAVALAPLEVADLHDHASSFNADNMHDLCLPRPPSGAKLRGVTIGGGLIQDPDGDPNAAQKLKAPRV